jgi:hypothetical protein
MDTWKEAIATAATMSTEDGHVVSRCGGGGVEDCCQDPRLLGLIFSGWTCNTRNEMTEMVAIPSLDSKASHAMVPAMLVGQVPVFKAPQ